MLPELKLEVGKYYATFEGVTVGPMRADPEYLGDFIGNDGDDDEYFDADGTLIGFDRDYRGSLSHEVPAP